MIDKDVKAELDQIITLMRKHIWSDISIQRYLQEHGVITEPIRFYSQLPSIKEIENSFEFQDKFDGRGPYNDPTIFNFGLMSEFMDEIQKFAKEFDPPVEGNVKNPGGYFWSNPAFSGLDALVYWCVLRQLKPRRVVEIGSGFSSLIAREALRKNGSGELICIEPYPMEWLSRAIPEMTLIEKPIQSVNVEQFNDLLGPGDVLFIDSTHTVKIGSDCLWIYLVLLPALAKSVTVHVHDIFLPFGVNKNNALNLHVHWAE